MAIIGKLAIACIAGGVVAAGLAHGTVPQANTVAVAKPGPAECRLAARFDGPGQADSRLAAQLRQGLGCKK